MRLTDQQIERFWSKVDVKSEDECWPWLAGIKTSGKSGQYGGFYIKQIDNTMTAHKVSFIITHHFDISDDIPDEIVIRHTCNNPICVNPKHLKLGTYQNNSSDMVESGNSLHGSKNPKASLTSEQVKEAREKWSTGEYSIREIGEIFNVSENVMRAVVKNIRYKDYNYTPLNFTTKSIKFSDEVVKDIKLMKDAGASLKDIKNKHNISITQIYNLVKNYQRKEVL